MATRLVPSAAAARDGSLAALIACLLARLGLAVMPGAMRAARRGIGAATILCRNGHAALRRASGAVARPARRAADWVPLTFGRTYALVSAALLGGFAWQTSLRPAPLFTQSDSFGYIVPGLVWASGRDMTGQSIRDIGYPLLTLLAVRLGSLAVLPRIQLLIVVAGMVCLLGALYLALRAVASRLEHVAAIPRWLAALVAAGLAAAFIVLLANHDLFVIDIASAMAEGPHVLPTALAALLFLGGWMATSGPWKVGLLASASLAAYASTTVKPHTLFVVPLCLASVAVACIRHRSAFRSPAVIPVCFAAALCALGINRLEAWVTPRGTDFGPKTLFCNHLDVIEPIFARSSPQRTRVSVLMRDTLSRVDGWPLLGYAGDGCTYNQSFTKAINEAAESEGETSAQWELREFLTGVLKNPLRYARDVLHQTAFFMFHPVANIDLTAHSDLDDADATVLLPYASLINMRRLDWEADAANWVSDAYPLLAGPAKRSLQVISDLFAPVTLLATALSAASLMVFRRGMDLRPEIAVVATACFTAAFAATVVLTHSFDVGRYVTDILPISLLWWFLSVVYLGQALMVAVAVSVRLFGRRRRSRANPSPRET